MDQTILLAKALEMALTSKCEIMVVVDGRYFGDAFSFGMGKIDSVCVEYIYHVGGNIVVGKEDIEDHIISEYFEGYEESRDEKYMKEIFDKCVEQYVVINITGR
jgi:hypothetical protein